MSNSKYRLSKITIENIKNTEYGEISFPIQGIDNERKAGLLGIYGANGSGKTAVIYALNILKTLMSGYALDKDTYNFITKGKNEAKLKFEFDFETKDLITYIAYEFKLAKDNDELLYVKDEKVTYKRQEDSRTLIIMDTTKDESNDLLFSPKLKYEHIKRDKETLIDLMVSSKMAHEKRESFIFRKETLDLLKDKWERNIEYHILTLLNKYANFNMFVILDNKYNHLPFFFRIADEKKKLVEYGEIGLRYGENEIDADYYGICTRVVSQLSLVLSEIVPGVELKIKDYGQVTLKDGSIGNRIELMSNKNGVEIPIKYESEGIKKIISILSALTAMFNHEGVLVAIDELDSGIFEYLLGSILEVINDTGSGQLIFTSHNLHPLEVLDSDNIVFTTINPLNRYIKFTNVRDSNNLRNVYLREIALRATGQKEIVYDDIKKHKISRAFRKAKNFSE